MSVIKLLTSVASRWIRESASNRAGQRQRGREIETERGRERVSEGARVSLCESFHYEYEYCAKMFDILSISLFCGICSIQFIVARWACGAANECIFIILSEYS